LFMGVRRIARFSIEVMPELAGVFFAERQTTHRERSSVFSADPNGCRNNTSVIAWWAARAERMLGKTVCAPEVRVMPTLIAFLIRHFVNGFLLGSAAAVAAILMQPASMAARAALESPVSLLLIVFALGSTLGMGSLATALWLDENDE
jgi:hypothetical protein